MSSKRLFLDNRLTPFNLDYTLDCGQVFRWERVGEYWYGIVGETIVKLRQVDDGLLFQTFPKELEEDFVRRYLRLDDDLNKIVLRINKDTTISRAIGEFHGLRIVRQEPWECLISYICATFSNIKRIKRMVRNLSQRFGKRISLDGYEFYTFPETEDLAGASQGDLQNCGLGFRARYVKEASKIIQECGTNLEDLKKSSYLEAKRDLLILPGVGPKVADCILLFSLEKLEAFPVDVWIKKIVSKYYGQYFLDCKSLNKKGVTMRYYKQINAFGREYFGEFAGYAQEYLYHYYRLHD